MGEHAARTVSLEEATALLASLVSAGPTWLQPLPAKSGALLGYLVVSQAQTFAQCLECHRTEDGWPREPTEGEVRRRLPVALGILSERLYRDLDDGLYWAKRNAETELVPRPVESGAAEFWKDRLAEAEQGEQGRGRHDRALAAWRFLMTLQAPASRFIPLAARRAVPGAEAVDGREASLGEFVALTIESGNPIALRAVAEWMGLARAYRRKTRADWRTILEQFGAVRNALRVLRVEFRRGGVQSRPAIWQRRADSGDQLVERLEAAGLKADAIDSGQFVPEELAASLVAAEYHVRPSTILQYWKRRRSYLPAGVTF